MTNEIEVYATHQMDMLRERVTVATESEYREVEKIARECKVMINQADAQIDPEIKQAHQLHKSLLQKKKEVVEPLKQVIDITSRMLGDYSKRIADLERIEARQIAKEQAAQAAAKLIASGDLDAAESAISHAENAPDSAIEKVDLMPSNLGTMTRTTYEIAIDASKVPKKYMCPDEQKIRAAVNKAKGDIEIKGVTITPVTKTHVR
jgi:TolA-binding protein